ncbi:peptidase M23 [Micromonospora thermarum]|uniref:Peptidase M23 n=1 Tax=Micromonospora thermarum TaxID=2720024 RepID=A0ABX0ZF23_9ACTN|nr:peptidase M23 [Micromonospora thermarum]NJP35797.1 peptidase M23 [Micromonospora thermarum]
MRNDGTLDDQNRLGGPAGRSDGIPSTDRLDGTFQPRLRNVGLLRTRLDGLRNLLAARRGRTKVAVATGAVCCLGLVALTQVGPSPAGESLVPDQRAEVAQRAEADAASRGLARESAAPATETPAPTGSASRTPTPKHKPKPKATSKAKLKRIAPVAGLDRAQMDNATKIVETGRKMGVPRRALVIAVATAMQESNLYNYASGVLPESQNYPHQAIGWDHDSVGLFQQRPSTGWGAVRDLMKPEFATRQFLTTLLATPGWQNLPLTLAAQAVQVSAFPYAYAQHEWRAIEVVDAILS